MLKLASLSALRGPLFRLIAVKNPVPVATCGAISTARLYSSASPISSIEDRQTKKHVLSRKTFLVDYYKYLNDNNKILLYVHHNNLIKAENQKFRSELKKVGAQLNIIRNSLYKVYLKSEHEADPADEATSQRNKNNDHPLFPLLDGPTGVISIPECNPAVVADVMKILKSAQEKLILVGARVEQDTFDIDQVDQFKNLPTKEQLNSQLAGLLTILGGAGLVRTLETAPNVLYLTMKEHIKNNEE